MLWSYICIWSYIQQLPNVTHGKAESECWTESLKSHSTKTEYWSKVINSTHSAPKLEVELWPTSVSIVTGVIVQDWQPCCCIIVILFSLLMCYVFRFFLASFYTKYDQYHFVVNAVSLLAVLIPKLPQFDGVRLFGINAYWLRRVVDWMISDNEGTNRLAVKWVDDMSWWCCWVNRLPVNWFVVCPFVSLDVFISDYHSCQLASVDFWWNHLTVMLTSCHWYIALISVDRSC